MSCLRGEEAVKLPTENNTVIKDSLTTVTGAQDADGYAGQRIGNYVRDSDGNWWTSYVDEDGYIHISNEWVHVGEGKFYNEFSDELVECSISVANKQSRK